MPLTGFADLLAGLGRLAALGRAETFAPTMEDEARALLADVQDRYGVYQDGWPPLADRTVLQRSDEGYPPDEPLLRTGGLRDSNTYSVETSGDAVTGYVGVPADDPHAVIAAAQELGTLGEHAIPPRPVLRPAAEAMGQEIADAFGAVVGAHIKG